MHVIKRMQSLMKVINNNNNNEGLGIPEFKEKIIATDTQRVLKRETIFETERKIQNHNDNSGGGSRRSSQSTAGNKMTFLSTDETLRNLTSEKKAVQDQLKEIKTSLKTIWMNQNKTKMI